MKIEFDEEKHLYFVDGEKMPSVTEIIAPITAKHYGSISQEVLRMAAERGTIVHEACEEIDYGLEAEVPAEFEPFVKAYCDFVNDYRVEYLGVEQIVYNREGRYCGTCDRWGRMTGKDFVLDIKTTTSPTKQAKMAGCCQTVAYADALNIPDAERYLLYLDRKGGYRLMDCKSWEKKNGFDSRKCWQLCLDLYRVLEESG